MYYKIIRYKNINILIFCTPNITEKELMNNAKQRYNLYENGNITLEELTGEQKAQTTIV